MGPPSQKVLSWLHNVLTSEYRHVNRTYSDIAQTLSYNPWISLKTDVYTFEQGNSALLLNLYGSLPVSFRGTTYAFPVSIWVPREYPQMAPINFVTPTKDMVVRPGQYISGEGRVYHPYLAGWKDDRSNVSEFIAVLQEIFAREPPLVTRQAQTPGPIPLPRPNGAPPTVPPLPLELGISSSRGERSASGPGQPPPPPPKPFDAQRQNTTHPGAVAPRLPLPPPRSSSQHGPPPHVRPKAYTTELQPQAQSPPQRGPSTWDSREAGQWPLNHQNRLGQQPQRDPISPLSPQTTVPSQGPWLPNSSYPQQYQRPLTQPAQPPPQDFRYPNGTRQEPLPPQMQHQQPHPQASFQQHLRQQSSQPQKPGPPLDLLSSPFEAALPVQPTRVVPPPIPPNPQKDALLSALSQTLAEQVRSTYASNMSAIPPLKTQQAALTTTLNNINKEISQLDELERLLSSNEAILHQAMRDADKVLEDAKKRQVPNVDEVLFAPTVVARQLYEAVADERAIEDCRTLLGKALDKGRIGSGVWAKQTRTLAREDFLKKALIKKISRGMGLIEENRWS